MIGWNNVVELGAGQVVGGELDMSRFRAAGSTNISPCRNVLKVPAWLLRLILSTACSETWARQPRAATFCLRQVGSHDTGGQGRAPAPGGRQRPSGRCRPRGEGRDARHVMAGRDRADRCPRYLPHRLVPSQASSPGSNARHVPRRQTEPTFVRLASARQHSSAPTAPAARVRLGQPRALQIRRSHGDGNASSLIAPSGSSQELRTPKLWLRWNPGVSKTCPAPLRRSRKARDSQQKARCMPPCSPDWGCYILDWPPVASHGLSFLFCPQSPLQPPGLTTRAPPLPPGSMPRWPATLCQCAQDPATGRSICCRATNREPLA